MRWLTRLTNRLTRTTARLTAVPTVEQIDATLAAEEDDRATNLALKVQQIQANPGHPLTRSVHLYQLAAREAYATAARLTEQPEPITR